MEMQIKMKELLAAAAIAISIAWALTGLFQSLSHEERRQMHLEESVHQVP